VGRLSDRPLYRIHHQEDDLNAGGWVVVWGAQLQRYGWDEGNEEGRGR